MASNDIGEWRADGDERVQVKLRDWFNTVPTWFYCGIYFVPLVAITVVTVLIISLITVYLPNTAVEARTNLGSKVFSITYSTNYKGNNSVTVADTNTVTSQLERAFDLSGNIPSLISLQFSNTMLASSVGRRKRSFDLQSCQQNSTFDGYQLYIQIRVNTPKYFISDARRTKFLNRVEEIIKNVRHRLMLIIPLEGGEKITVEMQFCSLQLLPAICQHVCSHGGRCLDAGICLCATGWNGTDCTIPICSSLCSIHGNCTSSGSCLCAAGWSGSDCMTPICSSLCSIHGNCTSPESCLCTAGWSGSDCTTPICSPPCGSTGNCTSPSTCLCAAGWSGSDCTTPLCSPPCGNGGTCGSPGNCICATGWSGSDCTTPLCSPPCGNGGTCGSPGNCLCATGWSGSDCTTPLCSPPCGNGGTCGSPGNCLCTAGWSGSDCTTPLCSPPCGNGGTCGSPGNCLCTTGWTGSDCTTASGGCYHGKDKVNLVSGGQRSIEHLKVGDRVWSPHSDGHSIIEDEIIMLMHNEPHHSAIFYTIETTDGHHVSLTKAHYIPVYDREENQVKYLHASKVTRQHHLIMVNRKIQIKNITIASRLGFFSPLTLCGSLFVNNISTSVFTDSYGAPPDTFQRFFTPVRVYYRWMRWCFGHDYNPFETNINKGVHPLIHFFKQHSFTFKLLYFGFQYIIMAFSSIYMLYYFKIVTRSCSQSISTKNKTTG